MISPLQRPVATWIIEEVKIKHSGRFLALWRDYLAGDLNRELPRQMIEERSEIKSYRQKEFYWDSASEARRAIKVRLLDEMERVKLSRYISRLYSLDQVLVYGYLCCAKVKINDQVFDNKHRTDKMIENSRTWYFSNTDNPLAKEYI